MDETTNNMMTFADLMGQTDSLKPLMNVVEQVMGLSDEALNEESVDMASGMLKGAFTPAVKEKTVNTLVQDFEDQGFTHGAVANVVTELKNGIDQLIADLKPSEMKERILRTIFGCFYEIFDTVLERFHAYNIQLPFKLDEGARVPTYAHNSDACADIYASEDTLVKAHTLGNMIHTGLHIVLPEGWQARLAPRSSIGTKTPLRMSNCQGIIDQLYTGELMVCYDNISDSDYQIKAGDRIAQMWVEPIYRFRATVIDKLPEVAERGAAGFGSSGR